MMKRADQMVGQGSRQLYSNAEAEKPALATYPRPNESPTTTQPRTEAGPTPPWRRITLNQLQWRAEVDHILAMFRESLPNEPELW